MRDLHILVVDDNERFCYGVSRVLNAQGYTHVRTATDGFKALEMVEKEHPDLVLLDLYLPGMDGMHVMSAIHKIDKAIPVMMLTSESDEECHQAAMRLGACDYLMKPLEFTTLFSSIETRLNEKTREQAA